MFTGLIEEIGTVGGLHVHEEGCRLDVVSPELGPEIAIGESVAVNGCCLTVIAKEAGQFSCDLLAETLARTNLGRLRPADQVNLERAVRAGQPMGGHFVQGHVDCTCPVVGLQQQKHDLRLEIGLHPDDLRYVAIKGSVAVNGTSLTISERHQHGLVTWIIPHTRQHTNLGQLRPGDLVNVEFDILAKYVEQTLPRMMRTVAKQPNMPAADDPIATR